MSFSIIGTGRGLPDCVKKNEELSNLVETSDEWIKARTGICQRHILTDETLTDISCKAAQSALENAGISPLDLDLIICSTIRGDYITPSMSCLLQERLGAVCPAFDINAACSGFIYALDVADGYFVRNRAEKVLIVCAEAMSKLVDWDDRATCVLFGDGAGAVVLAKGESLKSMKITANGGKNLLRIPNVEGNCPYNKANAEPPCLYMNGQEVYKFAVSSMCRDLTEVFTNAGIGEKDIDYILPHQANLRIIEAAQNRLKIAKEKYLVNAGNYGNISSASIPILLDEANREGKFKKGDLLAFSAFGGGLTSGACVIEWSK